MIIYRLGNTLEEIDTEELDACSSAVFLTDSSQGIQCLKLADICYNGDVNLSNVEFCKLETQQEYLLGFLNIPKQLQMREAHYHIMIFINEKHIVIIDEEGYAKRILIWIMRNRIHQGASREQFLYNFLGQIIGKDMELLTKKEQQLIHIEEHTLKDSSNQFLTDIMTIRKELLFMKGYYDQMIDLIRELEENENHFFQETQVYYFDLLANRTGRLMRKTEHLLSYVQTIRDAFQTKVETEQNKNMTFLTIISTIFFPLTLITGWYGMNFQNMPELKHGYPGVIVLSLIILFICILIFKKKHIL